MTVWESVTWDVARAGGMTAYVLLTGAVVLGLALSLRWQSPRWPRIINAELHNYVTLLATIFVGVHIVAVAIDPFTAFGWSEILLPFASHYQPFWMALGIVAAYLGIAIGISTLLRPRIGYALWRRLHTLTLAVYALVSLHGIVIGTDTRSWWALATYAVSIVLVGALFTLRLLTPATPAAPTRPIASSPRPVGPGRPTFPHSPSPVPAIARTRQTTTHRATH